MKHSNPHTTFPLRKIVRLETHAGVPVVLMVCGHATPGRPESARYSRFFPCSACHEIVLAARASHASTEQPSRSATSGRRAAGRS